LSKERIFKILVWRIRASNAYATFTYILNITWRRIVDFQATVRFSEPLFKQNHNADGWTGFNICLEKSSKRWKSHTPFTDYAADVDTRLRIIKQALTFTKAEFVIALGGSNGFKKVAFERIFGQGIFSPLPIQSGLTSYRATVSLPNKKLKIYLLPFPDQQVFGGEINLRRYMNAFLNLLIKDYTQNKS
jgi:hypothetical protein